MSSKDEVIFDGIVHFVSPNEALGSRGYGIYRSADGGRSWKKLHNLSATVMGRTLGNLSLYRRALRKGVHHIIPTGRSVHVFVDDRISVLSRDGHEEISRFAIKGSRPMVVCKSLSGALYYGEYRSNSERSAVSIMKYCVQEEAWTQHYSLTGVRHIHGIFEDPLTSDIWLTTGDEDDESAIWKTSDDFITLERVLGGSQQLRAVQLVFTDSSIYFGSDTPREANFLYRLDKYSGDLEQLVGVNGSVFFGGNTGGRLYFTTAVEPSDVNREKTAALWFRDEDGRWRAVRSFKKDMWHHRLFQYGQVKVASGPGDGSNIWITPFATSGSERSLKIPISHLDSELSKTVVS